MTRIWWSCLAEKKASVYTHCWFCDRWHWVNSFLKRLFTLKSWLVTRTLWAVLMQLWCETCWWVTLWLDNEALVTRDCVWSPNMLFLYCSDITQMFTMCEFEREENNPQRPPTPPTIYKHISTSIQTHIQVQQHTFTPTFHTLTTVCACITMNNTKYYTITIKVFGEQFLLLVKVFGCGLTALWLNSPLCP